MIVLSPATSDDWPFLFKLLKERPKQSKISHTHMPSENEHNSFWESDPYESAFIIYYDGEKAGLLYRTRQDEIGIHILKKFHRKGIAKGVIPCMCRKGRNLANINPQNKPSIKLFKGLGFKLLQQTYKLEI